MKFRTKLFTLLGVSQIMLTLVLTGAFVILVEKVKNEPQDKRAMEQAHQFQRELSFKEEKLKLLIKSITSNSKTNSLLQAGLFERKVLADNIEYFQEIMKANSLSIFELGDKNGKVHFRFHRPADFGDDKSGQKIIQSALKGEISSTLESGHSGLGFRMTAPFAGATILIGQKVDDEFTSEIAGADKTHMAVFEKKELRAASSQIIKDFIGGFKSIDEIISKERIHFQNENYYSVKIPYESNGLTNLSLEFLLLINETELHAATQKIWIYFYFILFFIIGIVFILSYLFSKDIIRAVKALNLAMSNIDQDEKSILDLNRRDEIGQMSNVFVKMKSELFSYQHHLEEMVESKTKELQLSLSEINELKVHQDGDYFLTSLLLKPLSNGNMKTENIVIESLVRQKKNFQFRNKFSEIGGDLCAVNNIYLKEKKYTVFMNADAMGKSLQGAGGALVMGTVFKSIIQNTLSIPILQQKYPERWLKDCYQELQNVFVSFDGSMLISCVIGLICEETGVLYYINIEHPYVILYRDRRASFLDEDMHVRKIGVEQSDMRLKVNVFQLEHDDIVILGSDGRDDILIQTIGGIRVINEDENQILHRVEEGLGELEKIEKAILSKGELTDDLTLMRVHFKNPTSKRKVVVSNDFMDLKKSAMSAYREGDFPKAIRIFETIQNIKPEDLSIKKELAKLYIKSKNFHVAIRQCEMYLMQRPADTEFLFLTSYTYKQARQFTNALDYGERVHLRDPRHVKNLINLAETYVLSGNKKRADYLLNLVDEIEPNNIYKTQLLETIT